MAQAVGMCLARAAAPAPKSKVVIARDAQMRSSAGALAKGLDRAVQAVYDRDNALEAWKLIARPNEVIGLKVNCLAGRGAASTSVALVEAICERLQQAGVPARNIVVWDRLNDDLESAGFHIATASGKLRCFGNDLGGYEEDLAMYGRAGSLLAKTLTRSCDAVINLPVLKDHGIVGVTMALKSLFGAIHNPNKYHSDLGDPYVADVYMLPPIRQKVRLAICDAVTAQYEGGPSYMPQWTWRFDGLIASRDPVALDYTGWQILEHKRAEMGHKSLRESGRPPQYIATAADAAHRIGTNDPARIDRVEL
ncbi:MAG: DUF362 domain-containing protein [Bryobacteraceae bacterium]